MVNDLFTVDLLIAIITNWSNDLFSCADSLQHYDDVLGDIPVRYQITVGIYYDYRNNVSIYDFVKHHCFCKTEKDNIANYLNIICNNPVAVFDKVYSECKQRYKKWDRYYKDDMLYIREQLLNNSDGIYGWGIKL